MGLTSDKSSPGEEGSDNCGGTDLPCLQDDNTIVLEEETSKADLGSSWNKRNSLAKLLAEDCAKLQKLEEAIIPTKLLNNLR
jgi:hypothetical protein